MRGDNGHVPFLRIRIGKGDILLDSHFPWFLYLCGGGDSEALADVLAGDGMFLEEEGASHFVGCEGNTGEKTGRNI